MTQMVSMSRLSLSSRLRLAFISAVLATENSENAEDGGGLGRRKGQEERRHVLSNIVLKANIVNSCCHF